MIELEEDYVVFRDDLAKIFLNIGLLEAFQNNFIPFLSSWLKFDPAQYSLNEAEGRLALASYLHQAIPSKLREKKDNNPYYKILA